MLKLALFAGTAIAVAFTALPAAAQNVRETIIVSGAMNDPASASAGQDSSDRATPELPVVYEDGK